MPSCLTVFLTQSSVPAYMAGCPEAGLGWVWRRTCKKEQITIYHLHLGAGITEPRGAGAGGAKFR